MPSQADASGDADFLSLVREYIKQSRNKPGNAYVGLVHRLDRPAGGLMAVALTSKAAARLSEQFASHTAGRTYLAVCRGVPPAGAHTHWLWEQAGMVRASIHEKTKAKKAVLNIQTLCAIENLTLCRIELQTGRKHQIRAQLCALGHPLWGDNRYDFGRAKPGEQLALWCAELKLIHPTTSERLCLESMPAGGVWKKFINCY